MYVHLTYQYIEISRPLTSMGSKGDVIPTGARASSTKKYNRTNSNARNLATPSAASFTQKANQLNNDYLAGHLSNELSQEEDLMLSGSSKRIKKPLAGNS